MYGSEDMTCASPMARSEALWKVNFRVYPTTPGGGFGMGMLS